MTFDMPATGNWETRGGWVVNALCRDLILKPHQAAGLVGNLGFESATFTAYHEYGQPADKGGVGWAQWTGPRRRAYEAWCVSNSLDSRSDQANYGYVCAELQDGYKSFLVNLRNAASIEDACLLTHRVFETASDVLDGTMRSQPARLALAKRALNGASAQVAPPAPQVDNGSNLALLDAALADLTKLRASLTGG